MQNRYLYSTCCAVVIITVLNYDITFAAENNRNNKLSTQNRDNVTKNNKQRYQNKCIDLNATSLPQNYIGQDIVVVIKKLDSAFQPRDEYETTKKYRNRLDAAYPKDFFAFVHENILVMPNAKYYADTRNMTVKIKTDIVKDTSKIVSKLPIDKETVIATKHVSRPTKQYEASNKFGAKTIKTEYTGTDYGIGLQNKDNFAFAERDFIPRERDITFDISPEDARNLKTNLGILYICKIKPNGDPPVHSFKSFYHVKATMDSPIEFSFIQYFVNVDLFEIWIFNKKTGTVFVKERIIPLTWEKEAKGGRSGI